MVTTRLSLPRLQGAAELLDRSDNSAEEIRENLRDLERLNRYFGGVRTVLLCLGRMVEQHSPRSFTILDMATGGADIPRAICRWARKRKFPVAIEAVDQNDHVLAAATEWSIDFPEIRLRQAQVPPLPYPDRSFDYVIASLFFHHLTEAEGILLLREMARVTRRGLLVNDLLRSRLACLLTAITTRLLSGNRLTRHDGPMSVLRGFRPEELRRMATEAGLTDVRLSRHLWFRIALTKEIAT
ncbi:MAG: methyltransferase domain-containing protein [Candidatus Methylomirabilis oxygeniifera]|uniref:Methyltransferase type 11 n=1 Tax=Methylomirabilis oxygeniifera TaxID=671143 RepID=D5MLA5_METO1|nr:MAG: methyltransferase domain-containing protein [Candidatus Methylomirabilis oxyfera]CBE67771.1 Methyltransferase type 11 [Candidatus Methylomirabilis oxyfera]